MKNSIRETLVIVLCVLFVVLLIASMIPSGAAFSILVSGSIVCALGALVVGLWE